MSVLDRLLACAGNWRGTSRLQDPNTHLAEESQSTATVSAVVGRKFVRIDYTWGYQGSPQEGSLLIGYEAKAGVVTAYWNDTWHMGDQAMACRGVARGNGEISVHGSYAAPPGPDWGWRTVITPREDQRLRIVMFNISPDDEREDLAVDASYVRA